MDKGTITKLNDDATRTTVREALEQLQLGDAVITTSVETGETAWTATRVDDGFALWTADDEGTVPNVAEAEDWLGYF